MFHVPISGGTKWRASDAVRLGAACAGGWIVALILLVHLTATCAAAASSFYPTSRKEAGAQKLAQVVWVASRGEILKLGKDYQRLLDSGLPDSALVDRSVGVGRVFCCGGLPAATHMDELWFYIPPDLSILIADDVEIRLGNEPGKGKPGRVNVVTRVRDRLSEPVHRCRWDPPNDRAWMRVLYCDSLEEQGWTHKRGIGNPWIKAPARDSNP